MRSFSEIKRSVMSHSARNRSLTFWGAQFSSNGVAHINEVTLRHARLVLGWVTMSGLNFLLWDIYLGM